MGSSQTRARTRVPCIGRQTLNHCATREAPVFKSFSSHYLKIVIFHIKTWISGFSLKIGISSNTGARTLTCQQSMEAGGSCRLQMPMNLNVLSTRPISHIYVTCLAPRRISLMMIFWSFPGYRKPFSKSSFMRVPVTFHVFRLFVQADFKILLLFLQFCNLLFKVWDHL